MSTIRSDVSNYFEKLRVKTSPVRGYQIEFEQQIHKINVLHLDQQDQFSTGNKWFKLKYNLLAAEQNNINHIASFGGAYSNHLHALGLISKALGFEFTAFIRGGPFVNKITGEPTPSPMLQDLQRWSDQANINIEYLSYGDYKLRYDDDFCADLSAKHQCLIIPEGGSNELAVQGCEEILSNALIEQYDNFVIAAGTGATAAGIQKGLMAQTRFKHKKLCVVPVLKQGEFILDNMQVFTETPNTQLWLEDHCGGYGKTNAELLECMAACEQQGLILDPVYTGKVVLAALKKNQDIDLSKTLIIHTGGLQGRRK